MSFTNLSYDTCAEETHLEESAAPGLYQINTPILCNTCFQDNPQLINQRGGVSMNSNVDWRFYDGPVDVESDLKNINRPGSKCPGGQYQPRCSNCGVATNGQACGDNGAHCDNDNNNNVDFPDCHFPIENSRLCNPPSTLRGTGLNRFEYPCNNPQDRLEFPGVKQVSTRLSVRDNHRPCLPNPQINSMDPNEKAPCFGSHSDFTIPLHMRCKN